MSKSAFHRNSFCNKIRNITLVRLTKLFTFINISKNKNPGSEFVEVTETCN